MYRIAVCDDDKIVSSHIEKVILNFGKCENIVVDVDVYHSGEGLINEIKKGEYYDLIFLDIEFKMSSGIEVGKLIRDQMKNDATHIVYISAYSNYALDLFKIRPLDFLIKPFEDKEIILNLKKSMELSNYNGQTFSYKKGWDTHRILIKNILYFKSNNKEVEIHTTNGVDRFYSSLEKIYEKLMVWRFFYCHQSFLVNYNQIETFKYDELVLYNGEVLKISQGKRKQVREMLQTFEMEDF